MVQTQHGKQLNAYALLLDHRFGTKIRRGVLYFAQQREVRTIEIIEEDRKALKGSMGYIRRIMASEVMSSRVS
jgi:CRISPR/Cas system-associated exonuclease Cas4 (RecB family)